MRACYQHKALRAMLRIALRAVLRVMLRVVACCAACEAARATCAHAACLSRVMLWWNGMVC